MMKSILLIFLSLLPFLSYSQAPSPYPVLVDSQRDTIASLQVFQANAITFRANFRSGNATNAIVTEAPFMYWMPYGATNATVVTGRWTIVSASGGLVDFTFTPSDLNFATGTYAYQIGLQVSGGPTVIKQGAFVIKASQASIGASPIAFATTNVNWGLINWAGLPAYEYQTNTIAISNALYTQIQAIQQATNWSVYPAKKDVNFAQYYSTNMAGIDFDLTPSGASQQGRLQWNAGRSTLQLGLDGLNLDVGQQLVLYARGVETNTISKGDVVFVSGAFGDNPTVKRASNASEALSSRTIGIAAENIASNANGMVVTAGTVFNIPTTQYVAGASLYLGPNGTLQTNLPDAPLHGVHIGTVERVHANAGQIFVHIQNYQELRELSDVNINGVANRDLIAYNTASNRWQNYSLASLGIATGSPLYAFTESDPVFAAASNSLNTRITANTTGKVDVATYAPATSALWTAFGNIISAENALTNVTASGRITAIKTGAVVALTFDASGLATGTPIYSVDGLATGTPIYAETQFIANSNRITLLEEYTNRAASALSSSVWASADSTTNYASQVEFISSSNSFNTSISALNGYTNRAASALSSSVWANADSTTNYASRIAYASFTSSYASADSTTNYANRVQFIATSNTVASLVTNVAARLASNIWAAADSTTNYASRIAFNSFTSSYASANATTNYASRIEFIAASNSFNSSISTLNGFTNRAASALTSSVWANADSTTNYASRVSFNSFTSSYATADSTTNYASRITFNATSNELNSSITSLQARVVYTTNLSAIAGSGLGVTNNQFVVTNVAGNFEGLIGNNFSLGNSSVTNISSLATGSFVAAYVTGTNKITDDSYGSQQSGYITGTASIDDSSGSIQAGVINGTALIQGKNADGSSQMGKIDGYVSIGSGANWGIHQRGKFISGSTVTVQNSIGSIGSSGASQIGGFSAGSVAFIGSSAAGALQIGYLNNSYATNRGYGAIQVMGGFTGEVYDTTSTGDGSILLGPGTQTNAYGILANGPIQTLNRFIGSASGLTNFPSSLLTISAAQSNYWQITTVPVSNNSFGQRGHLAVDGTNLFIYSPDALGSGTGRWGRVGLNIAW